MPLVTEVEIENFRCFEKLRISGLTRVNLLVGANNSGKTAFLEAIEWAANEGNALTIYQQLQRREEMAAVEGSGSGPDLGALFHGTPIRLTVDHKFSATLRYDSGDTNQVYTSVVNNGQKRSLRFTSEWLGGNTTKPVRNSEIVLTGDRIATSQAGSPELKHATFVTSNVASTGELRNVFAKLGASRSKIRARDAMKLLDNRVEAFEYVPSINGRPEAFELLLEGEENGHPIGRFGEGFRRVVRLAFSLGEAQGSVLLIDEIENGVHYSVMPQVWTFLVKAARELDVQVFAATHSKDVLDAIGWLSQKEPDLASDVSIHRLEVGRPSAVRISPNGVLGALESDQEVR